MGVTPKGRSRNERSGATLRRRAVLGAAIALLALGSDCEGSPYGDRVGGPELINNSGHPIRVVVVEEDGDELFLDDVREGGQASLGVAPCNDRVYVVRTRPEGEELDRREPGALCRDDVWMIAPAGAATPTDTP